MGLISNISSTFLIFLRGAHRLLCSIHDVSLGLDFDLFHFQGIRFFPSLDRRKPWRFSIYLIQLCYLLEFVQPYTPFSDELRRYGGRQRPRVRLTSTQKGSLLSLLLSYLPQSNCTGSRVSNNSADISRYFDLPFDRRRKTKSRIVSRVKFSRYASACSFVFSRIVV